MPREPRLGLEDILEAVDLIGKYIADMGDAEFIANRLIQDAVVRNLLIIGEACSRLPQTLRNLKPGVDWRGIVGLRNVLAHDYAAVNYQVVWDVINTELAPLARACQDLLDSRSELPDK